MKEESLISFELAKKLNDLDIELPYWCNSGFHYRIEGGEATDGYFMGNSYKAPLLYDVQKWFREKHNIEVRVHAEHYLDGTAWNVQALKFNLLKEYQYLNFIEDGTMMYGDNGEYDTYEKALLKGLELGLTLIK